MNTIHPTAVIYDNVELGDGNEIGAYTVIGSACEMRGDYNRRGKVIIGDNNVITNHVTIDSPSLELTKIGNGNFIMNKSHIGHDVRIGDSVTIAPFVSLGGHCVVEDFANLGMGCIVHQKLRIGEGVMGGMGAVVTKNVPPFMTVIGVPAQILRVNQVGLCRRGETYDDDKVIEFRKNNKPSL